MTTFGKKAWLELEEKTKNVTNEEELTMHYNHFFKRIEAEAKAIGLVLNEHIREKLKKRDF